MDLQLTSSISSSVKQLEEKIGLPHPLMRVHVSASVIFNLQTNSNANTELESFK